MDDKTFKIKSLEFHLKQKSIKYENCVSAAVKMFLDTKVDFDVGITPCKDLGNELKALLSDYEELTSK